jgi:hypothetical protein
MSKEMREQINKVKNFKQPIKEEILNEIRKSFMNYLKEKLPNTPEYVVNDWFYKNNKNETQENIDELINKYKDVKWELKKNFPMSLNILSDETQKRLKEREGGKKAAWLDNDEERHQTQKELILKKGLPTEPIIMLDLNGKYELVEGWHRTIQLFSLFPEGFKYPNVYVGKATDGTDISIYI